MILDNYTDILLSDRNTNGFMIIRIQERGCHMTVEEKIQKIVEFEKLCSKANGGKFEKYKECKRADGTTFSQADIIRDMLSVENDVMTIMPTSMGKSLCFQESAIFSEGITVVISPLVALIDDQVTKFNNKYCDSFAKNLGLFEEYKALGICDGKLPCAIKNGEHGLHYNALFEELRTGKIGSCIWRKNIQYKLLYVSPESLIHGKFQNSFVRALTNHEIKINAFVLDEVHCLAQWGLEFRPSYLKLRSALDKIEDAAGTRIIKAGFTATATQTDIDFIKNLLGMRTGEDYICRIPNNNLFLDIQKVSREKKFEVLKSRLWDEAGRVSSSKCLVFCNSKAVTEELRDTISKEASDQGVELECLYFHAGMSVRDKAEAEIRFRSNDAVPKVMFCTIAFALGIDISDIDYVVCYGRPKSLEILWQEIGRTGRGEKQGRATIIYDAKGDDEDKERKRNISRIAKSNFFGMNSPLENVSDVSKDILYVMNVYRYAKLVDAIDKVGSAEKSQQAELLAKAIADYCAEEPMTISDFINSDRFACCVPYFGKKGNLLEGIRQELEKVSFLSSNRPLKNIEDKVKEIDVLKVNNTQVAHRLRTDRDIRFGEKRFFVEKERRIQKLSPLGDEEDSKLFISNRNIFEPTLFVYVDNKRAKYDCESIKSYVRAQYLLYMKDSQAEQISYVYCIKHDIEDESKKNIIVLNIYRADNEELTELLADGEGERLPKEIRQHLGSVANRVMYEGVSIAEMVYAYYELMYDDDLGIFNPTFYVPGRRQRDINFSLEKLDPELSISEENGIISYFDMAIQDVIYTLYFNGKKKVYLQDIWKVMSGRTDIKLPTGVTKNRIIDSIEKMRNIKIKIHDSRLRDRKNPRVLNGDISGVLLDLEKSDRGYFIKEKPVLFEYAELLNGEIISVNVSNFDMRKYISSIENGKGLEEIKTLKKNSDSVRGICIGSIANEKEKKSVPKEVKTDKTKHASVESALLIHYISCRASIYNRAKIMRYINCDTVLNVLEGELAKKHQNREYVYEMMYAVLQECLKARIKRKEIKLVPYFEE